jgi:hypothetical protein
MAASTSLQLSQLFATPISALVQAEALAAETSANFIETFGFVKQGGTPADSLGSLKTVTFTYVTQDVNGENTKQELSLPVLSLVPIPLLQIKEASLEFDVKVTGIVPADEDGRLTSKQKRYSFLAIFGRRPDDAKADVDMKIKVTLVQSDIPVGLTKLFQVMDNSVVSKKQ